MCKLPIVSKIPERLSIPPCVNGLLKTFQMLADADGNCVRKIILYIHIVAYPVVGAILMLGRDIQKLYTHGFKSLLSDQVSFGLCISILTSLVISTVFSFYLILRSFRQFSFKALQIYTVIYFVSVLLNNCMYSFKNERDGKIEQRSVFYSSLNLVHIWQFILDGTTLMITIEQLKVDNGFLQRRSLFGVPLVKLVYLDLALVWVACFQIVFLAFNSLSHASQHEEKIVKWVIRELHVPFYVQIISFILCGLDGLLLWKGINKKSPKLLRLYLAIKITLFFPFTISWNIINYRKDLIILKKPSNSLTKMFPMFAGVPYIVGIFIIDSFIKSFSEYLQELHERTQVSKCIKGHNLKHDFNLRQTKDKNLEKITKEFLKTENISRILVRLDGSKLGSGHSANAYKGKLCKKIKSIKVRVGATVVVKVLRESEANLDFQINTSESYTAAIFSEIKFLNACSNGHEHLVKFYGVTRFAGDLGIVMEYCCGGTLEKYLRAKRKSPEFCANVDKLELLKLHKWAAQIASAFEFLSNKKIVHGDLATRNILLDEYGNAKVSDFGSAIHLYNYQSYAKSKQAVFPWRWMAPESLSDLKFSLASDIWSYGVLLWELYSFGEIPWQGLDWTSDFVFSLRAGMILEKPQFASVKIYQEVICNCLRVLEEERMSFEEISEVFLPTGTVNRLQNEYT